MKKALAVIDWFIPVTLRFERSELSLARNFVFTHLFGPLMSQAIIIFLRRTDPTGGWRVWTVAICVWGFLALPLLLRATGNLRLCAFISTQLLAFVSLFGAYHYGGATSPFLPWLIVSLLLGFFYLSKQAKLVIAGFAINFGGFFLAFYRYGFEQRVSASQLEVVGWLSILSATIYMGWMAIYYTSMLSMRDELERESEELAATTKRLQAAKNAADLANANRSVFLAKMSHELRTPLNAVIGYSEMLLEDVQADGKGAQKGRDLERISASGKHLLSLVTDVLDISRIERNEIDVVINEFDLNAFAAELAESSSGLFDKNNNRFVLDFAAGMGTAKTDATKLRQIALNLLSNAAKFTSQGTVTLSIHRSRASGGAGDWIEIQVSDTGIGLSQSAIDKLFTDFIQASASTSSRFGGSGIGLAHSQKLAGLLGGRISVTSKVDKGSVFVVKVLADLATIAGLKAQTVPNEGTSAAMAAA